MSTTMVKSAAQLIGVLIEILRDGHGVTDESIRDDPFSLGFIYGTILIATDPRPFGIESSWWSNWRQGRAVNAVIRQCFGSLALQVSSRIRELQGREEKDFIAGLGSASVCAAVRFGLPGIGDHPVVAAALKGGVINPGSDVGVRFLNEAKLREALFYNRFSAKPELVQAALKYAELLGGARDSNNSAA